MRIDRELVRDNALAALAEDARWRGEMISNASLLRSQLLTKLFDFRRDIDLECGYPKEITREQLKNLYDREGLATRIIRVFPEESWALDPDVYEIEEAKETAFEKAWKELQTSRNLYGMLCRADELSGIGRFGILLLGLDDGKPLDQPVEGVGPDGKRIGAGTPSRKLLYLRAFDESLLTVKAKDVDPNSPRYGQPVLYDISMENTSLPSGKSVTLGMTVTVHWTRVIHLADNRTSSEVYGTPRLQMVFNRCLDVQKLAGGSAEMFWKGAFPGLSMEVDPTLQGVTLDADSIREEVENYQNGLQRYLALQGITAKPLPPQVADPRGHVEVQLDLIAISLGVPKRILFGSEQAQLASGQDTRTWNKRLSRRRDKYITPLVLRPFVDRMLAVGVLPEPKDGPESYQVHWPDLNSPSDLEQAQVATQRVDAMVKYIQGGVDNLIPPAEFLEMFMGMDPEEVEAVLEKALERIGDEGQDALEARAVEDEKRAKEIAAGEGQPLPSPAKTQAGG